MKGIILMSLNHTRKVCLRAYSDFGKADCAVQIRFDKKNFKIQTC